MTAQPSLPTILVISFICSALGRLHLQNYLLGAHPAINIETNPEGNLLIHNRGEFAFMAEIERFRSHWCGGAIISSDAVLTAAHCVENLEAADVLVRVGGTFLQDNGFAFDSVQERNVRRILIHPKHRIGGENNNDIAIIWTRKHFDLNKYVNVVNLAGETDDFSGEEVAVLGWGKTETRGLSGILLKAAMTLIPQKVCKKVYGKYLTDRMICAFDHTSKNASICENDSGGPMVLHFPHNPRNDILLGVISWSNNDENYECDTTAPSVFTRVAVFQHWIREQLETDAVQLLRDRNLSPDRQ